MINDAANGTAQAAICAQSVGMTSSLSRRPRALRPSTSALAVALVAQLALAVARPPAAGAATLGGAGAASAVLSTSTPSASAKRNRGPIAAPVGAPAAGYAVEPVPAWVVPAVEAGSSVPVGAALHFRVVDRQTRLANGIEEHYAHFVRVVDETAGLSVASQIEIEFDPSYSTLALHHIDIVRAGQRTTRLDRRRIRLLQRETQLERRSVDGRMTLAVALDDVRTGDEVDYAYTVRGANPVFAGRYAETAWLVNDQGPVLLESHRLLAPADRSIRLQTGPADVQTSVRLTDGGNRETISRRRNVPVFRIDPGASAAVAIQNQWVATEYADWTAVAGWGAALFAEPAGPAPGIDKLAASIRNDQPTPAGRLRAALDFVQKQVRYFGTEIGVNSHRPAAPEAVLQQRFGDCKDKVTLLLALLRRLDIAGEPVLVSTQLRRHVGDLPPTPLAFNHVIARVVLDGRTFWLDATRDQQTGALESRQALGFGLGLPLGVGAAGLIELPSAAGVPRIDVDDQFSVAEFGSPPTLEARITYRGDYAEGLREALARQGAAALQAQVGQNYMRLYPKIRSLRPIVVEEAADENAVTLVQRFSVPDFWRFPDQRLLTGSVGAWSIADALRVPSTEARRDAFVIPAPGLYSHHIGMRYPVDVFPKPSSQNNSDDEARVALDSRAEIGRRSVDLTLAASIRAEEVAAADWPAYTARLRKLMPRLGMAIPLPPVPLDKADATQAELKRLEDAARSARPPAATRIQAEAPIKVAALDAVIAGGRLEAPLLARALTLRAIELDHLGRAEAASADIDRAIALAPDDHDTLTAGAVDALLQNRPPVLASLTDRLLQQNGHDVEALNLRVLGRFMANDTAGASEALQTLLRENAAWQRGYPLVLWSLLQRRISGGAGAPPDTGGVPHESELPTDWPRPLIDWSRGKTDTDAMLAAARAGPVPAERLCEAWYYLGERFAAEGDLRRAEDAWRKSVQQGVREFTEDGLSRLRLAQLAQR